MPSDNDKPDAPASNDDAQKLPPETNDDDGKTVKISPQQAADDDKTVLSPDVDDDGETAVMPAYNPDDEDDGETAVMPEYNTDADDGETVAMPEYRAKEDDGETVAMPGKGDSPAPTTLSDQLNKAPSSKISPPPAGDDRTVASVFDVKETEPDHPATPVEPKESEKPTRVTPQNKTQTGQDVKTTKTDSAKEMILQNRYRIEKQLGQGGFGAAYLAEDIKLKRGCVVKQMRIPSGTPPKQVQLFQANFEREASLLAQLNQPGHPNIPEIFDYFSDETGNYLVMKYIEGQSLQDVIDQNPEGIPWREAVRYIIDVADALNYMHSHHGEEPIMHRDIKPDNILRGNDNRVWLVDFGLAKADPVEDSGDINASMAAGTLGFTPLEQWLGEAVPASDVYALGATLHHLVTGRHPKQPFGGEFNIHKLKELHGVFPPVREINKNLPKELEALITGAATQRAA